MKLFSFVPGPSSIIVARSLWTTTMTVIIIPHEIFKTHCPLSHYELGQMMEVPLGTHPGMIRTENFYTNTVSILLVLMFEKCRFRENYPQSFWRFTRMLTLAQNGAKCKKIMRNAKKVPQNAPLYTFAFCEHFTLLREKCIAGLTKSYEDVLDGQTNHIWTPR